MQIRETAFAVADAVPNVWRMNIVIVMKEECCLEVQMERLVGDLDTGSFPLGFRVFGRRWVVVESP